MQSLIGTFRSLKLGAQAPPQPADSAAPAQPPPPQDTADVKKEPPTPNAVKGKLLTSALARATGMSKATDTPPTGPIADLYADLAKTGYKTSNTQINHTIECLGRRREALVSFEDKKDLAYSFANQDEIRTFAAMATDSPALAADARTLFNDLKTLSDGGCQFHFNRKGFLRNTDLRTDAAGAAILLRRGEPITMLDRYGSPLKLDKPADAQQRAARPQSLDAAREPVLQAVKGLEEKGYRVHPEMELPENIQVGDIGKMMKHQLKQIFKVRTLRNPLHPMRQREYVINQLAGQGRVAVAPPPKEEEDGSPLEQTPASMPSTLNGEQVVEMASVVCGKPTARAQQFMDDMKAIGEKQKPLVMSRASAGLMRGLLGQTDELKTYTNLVGGGEMVLMGPDGSLQNLDNTDQVHQLAQSGTVPAPSAAPIDPAIPKTNLLMVYHDAPFDPAKVYEDFPLRAAEVGSNPNLDIVMLRSDMPQKKNLRLEYVQKDHLQLLEQMDSKLLMSDPKLLENFIYQSLKAHPQDGHLRLMVAGHGGAEKGLLPDGEANDAAAHGAMPVDVFADAIHNGLQKFNKETGQQRQIDNLVVASCLMGNTSFIYALSKRGDVRALSASPEMLQGNSPTSFVKYLADDETANHSAQQFAHDLVDQLKGSAAFPGGKKNLQFADTYGAYDLTPARGTAFKDALAGFFDAALAEPKYARYLKDDVAHCPTYGGNAIMNLMFGIQQRDVIQVAERVAGDARIGSRAIKSAARALVQATQDLVMRQEMNERYADRRGPTLYLPTDQVNFDEKMMQTSLTKDTAHEKFLRMLFGQPLNRTLLETIKYENGRITHEIKDLVDAKKAAAKTKAAEDAAAKAKPAEEAKPADVPAAEAKGADKPKEETAPAPAAPATAKKPADIKMADLMKQNSETYLQGLEKTYRPFPMRLYNAVVATPLTVAAAVAGAAIGTALASILLIPTGAILGLRAGLRGNSLAQRISRDEPGGKHAPKPHPPTIGGFGLAPFLTLGGVTPPPERSIVPAPYQPAADAPANADPVSESGSKPAEAAKPSKPKANELEDIGLEDIAPKLQGPMTRIAMQASLLPIEGLGELVNRKLSYHFGNKVGALGGGITGLVTGIAGGGCVALATGGLIGGTIFRGIARAALGPHD